jgi:hypothetical protein
MPHVTHGDVIAARARPRMAGSGTFRQSKCEPGSHHSASYAPFSICFKRHGQFLGAFANNPIQKPCGSSQPEPRALNSAMLSFVPKRIGRLAA